MSIRAVKLPLPREHGAWAMWGVPLLIGTLVAPTVSPRLIILVMASLALFLLRYPLAMLVKTRSRRAPDRAWWLRWSIGYGAVAAICGLELILIERLYFLIPIGFLALTLIALNLWLVARKQEMSIVGEWLGIGGLALGAPLAYGVAYGQVDGAAAGLWLVNTLYFGGTVLYIKLKVRQQPRQTAPERVSDRLVKARACLTYQTLALTLIMAAVGFIRLPLLIPLAFLPMTLKVIHGAVRWQDKRSLNLPRLGVIEVIHAALFAVLVIAAYA